MTTINSQSYWDDRFATDWESCEGREQSRFFAQLAIEYLPAWFKRAVAAEGMAICDWGCAEGDGTDILATSFGREKVTGVDFSEIAIQRARELHSDLEFKKEDWLSDEVENQQYDVVFSSNTLEHFYRPNEILEKLGQFAKKMIVLALPYREFERIEEHHHTFLAENLPLFADRSLILLHAKVIDCEKLSPTYWEGQQIILVYARGDWAQSLGLSLSNITLEDVESGEKDSKIASLNQVLAERDAQLARLADASFEAEVDESQVPPVSPHQPPGMETADRYLAQISSLNLILTERDQQMSSLGRALDERDAQLASLDLAVTERAAAVELLETIRKSRSWRLTQPLRLMARTIRHGLLADDRRRLIKRLRAVYQTLPLSSSAKKALRWLYYKIFGDPYSRVRRQVLSATRFQPQSIRPAIQETGVPDYIFWGVIDWHFRHQRPQQMAQALAARGRRVFYVSVCLEDDERAGFDAEPLSADARLFQIKLYAKGAPVIYSSAPGLDTVGQLRRSIGELLKWADCRSIISLVQHPFWYDIASVLPDSRIVYDCMDHHEGFGNNATAILSLERELLRNADLTVTTSDWLNQTIAEHTSRRALIRNAGDFEHFAHKPATIYRDPRGRQIIGYYGAIADWFDQDLVEAVAERFPECCVLLIGDDSANAKARLGKFPNVKFVGEVPYAELPHHLHSFDVCLLPFKVIPLTLATNPVKVYEYLSAGKPVVTVDLPEMKQFGGLLRVATSTEGFLSAIVDVLNNSETTLEVGQRQIFAKEQTWIHRADALIAHAELTSADPKTSVVVVTYNNLDFTRACLASLDEFTNYSHLEVIVVDNASTDGSEKFLSEWVNAAPNRQLILNGDNRGFAAANNQGLAIASGAYLVLLNNDTYVTPGWCRTLLKHLQRDSSIGLIGPVTNNIGNEAKINISYGNMGDMLELSARFTRSHIGRTFPLRTAAFFCVMMPCEVYERVGPLDESFGRGFFEDDDYCRRIEQLGLRVVCAEDVFVHHHLSASFSKLRSQERQALFEQNQAIYEAKWGKWVPHAHGTRDAYITSEVSRGVQHVAGRCNVCGKDSRFFYTDVALWRESLACEHCLTTSRYRSIARGILRAIGELTGINSLNLAALPRKDVPRKLRIYDTQPPFYYEPCAYPIPDLMKATGWIDVELSQYKPKVPLGEKIIMGVTNQNLERLTFDSASLDVVITSDVMEHVRLDDRAHQEIHRVLRMGGIYIFTVPHDRAWEDTLLRVQITDPDDASKDVHLLEPEYHGDTNSDEGRGVLSYRVYGRDLEDFLTKVGFEVEYSKEDIYANGILNTELYYCRKVF